MSKCPSNSTVYLAWHDKLVYNPRESLVSVSDDGVGCDISLVAMDSDWQDILALHGHEDIPGGGQ